MTQPLRQQLFILFHPDSGVGDSLRGFPDTGAARAARAWRNTMLALDSRPGLRQIQPMTETATEPAPARTCSPVNQPSAPEPASTDIHPIQLVSPKLPRRKTSRVQQTVQAANLQRFTYDCGIALRQELMKDGELKITREDAQALGQLVKAWDTAADRLRVLRGKGLPASVRSKPGKTASVEPLNPA